MTVAVCLLLTLAVALVYCDELRSDRYGYCHDNTVHTTLGRVRGLTENIPVDNGRPVAVDMYLGIPYAKPPLGDLRFRRSLPADPWVGIFQARTPPNSCVQVPRNDTAPFPPLQTPISEDCLYLNIWRPRCGGKLTTMVWIDGELLAFGSSVSDLYKGSKLAASECVIVASLNYRMGVFGFLALNSPESPGNMGLSDVTLALQWIKDNVKYFGGDPSRITLFGGGFGSALTFLVLLSPLTRNLINNAIIQDGSADFRYSYRNQQASLTTALKFADLLKCSSENRTAIVQCLRQVDAAQLALQYLTLSSTFQDLMVGVIDGYFLTTDPKTALKTGDFKRCEIMTGNNQDVGTYAVSTALADTFNLRRQPPVLCEQELDSNLTALLLTLLKPEFIPGVICQVKLLYNYNMLKLVDRNPSLSLLIQVSSDALFRCPIRRQVTAYANVSQAVYLYSFEHGRDISALAPWAGATLAIETPFVFGTTSRDFPAFSRRETRLKQSMMQLWANFAKYGNPTPGPRDRPRWPKYSASGPANILQFTKSTQIRVGRTDGGRCDYWDNLPLEYMQ